MKLRDIAEVDSDSEVTGFAIDHRNVAAGSVFGAFKGALFNGEDFIGQAVDRGAVAVVARPEATVDRVPLLADPEPRRLFAELAASFCAPFPRLRFVARTAGLLDLLGITCSFSDSSPRNANAARRFRDYRPPAKRCPWPSRPGCGSRPEPTPASASTTART